MAKLSKRARKIISETVRQMIANLGLRAPINEAQSEANPESAQQKSTADIVSEWITSGIFIILWGIFSAAVINYFSQFSWILYFGATGISSLLLFGAGKLVWFHKRHWRVFLISVIACVAIWTPTILFVNGKNLQTAKDEREHGEERTVITNIPSRFDKVDSALAALMPQKTDPKQQIRSILEQIHPQVLQLVDAGQRQIAVMISQNHLMKLQSIPDLANFIEMQPDGSVSMGGNNQIGGHIMDQEDPSYKSGFVLMAKDSLRK
jgi:hypothetical protein